MRNNILFKAKAIEEGVGWLIGSLVITDDNRNNPFRTAPIKKCYQIIHYCAVDWNMGGWELSNVDPDTICQFTGLIDKNGNKVWEGDIVRFDDSPYNAYATPYSGEVVFHQGCWCVKHKFYDHYVYPPLFRDDFADRKTEVLGNKFDNPELLTKNEYNIGCKYACVCGGICPGCSRYEPEEYYGHAEDVLAQSKGFQDDEDYQRCLYEIDEARHNDDDYDY